MDKKQPMRTCIGCRTVRPKRDMIRIVRSPDGEISADPGGKAQGRGAYICGDAACFAALVKTKALNRTFKMQVSDDVYERLKSLFDT